MAERIVVNTGPLIAKLLGLLPALRPLIERAVERGIRYHPELVRQVLSAVGE
jgi:hypothetical protein